MISPPVLAPGEALLTIPAHSFAGMEHKAGRLLVTLVVDEALASACVDAVNQPKGEAA